MIDDVYFNGNVLPRSNISSPFISLSALIDTVSFFFPSHFIIISLLISFFFFSREVHSSEVQTMSFNTSSIYLEMEVDTHVLILIASHSPSEANFSPSILEILQLRLYLILLKFVPLILLRRILHMWVDISLVGVWGFLFRKGSFFFFVSFFLYAYTAVLKKITIQYIDNLLLW